MASNRNRDINRPNVSKAFGLFWLQLWFEGGDNAFFNCALEEKSSCLSDLVLTFSCLQTEYVFLWSKTSINQVLGFLALILYFWDKVSLALISAQLIRLLMSSLNHSLVLVLIYSRKTSLVLLLCPCA